MNEHPDATDALLAQALKLPTALRARLAAELIASVDGEPDASAEAAWALEIDRRVRSVEATGASGDDWPTVRSRIAARLRSK